MVNVVRDSDIGAYNEVMIGVPVTIDTPGPLFTRTLQKVPELAAAYICYLPVTTSIACDAGTEFLGAPTFVAAIEVEESSS